MVESSGGNCRCTCQEEFQDGQDNPTGCCSPHIFTSVLLGILSCVLMTGGVFLAFHKWDPMWLMVSGVGVVLILIGTILHCCHNMSHRPKRHSIGGKGCCSRPIPPEHSGHIISNNGSLTEQLLPLSNARSVSQLSLNMLPGYFPPVVTAYGIEQHSAVVQNINRLVQQQQQQQQQQPPPPPQNPGSCSPGVASTTGKSFIVLSLPGDTTAANIQNLVATVYQIDGNGVNESAATETGSLVTQPILLAKPAATTPLLLKNAEVQTCNIWTVATPSSSTASTSAGSAADILSANEVTAQVNVQPANNSVCSGATQTDEISPTPDTINLMDCSSDICDTPPSDHTPADQSPLVNIPSSSSSADLIDVTLPSASVAVPELSSNNILVDIPDPIPDHVINPSPSVLVDVVVPSPGSLPDHPDVLIDITEDSSSSNTNSNNLTSSLGDLLNNDAQREEEAAEGTDLTNLSTNVCSAEPSETVPDVTCPVLEGLNSELLSSNSNLSAVDTEIDDSELLERSSPPPSYEDVTLEGEAGAFGLAYGTI